MSVPRYRANKFFIPGLSQIWNQQRVIHNNKSSSKDNMKKKQMSKAYQNQLFVPMRIKSRKEPEIAKNNNQFFFGFQQKNAKGPRIYRYFQDKSKLNTSRKQLDRLKNRQRSSVIQSYRPASRTTKNASTSRVHYSSSKDSYYKLTNRSKLQSQIQSVSKMSQINPNDQLKIAKQFYIQGNVSEAENMFTQLLSQKISVLQCHYFLGIIQIKKREWKNAIDHLKIIVQNNYTYKKSTYLFLATAYKSIQDFNSCIQTIQKGLAAFPMFYDLLILRGKVLMINNQYQKAQKDFSAAINIQSNCSQAYINKTECLVILSHYNKAITTLTTLMYIDEWSRSKILLQRADLFFKINQIKQCKKDLQKLIQLKQFTSQIYELKGRISQVQGNIAQSILYYEQSITLNTSKKSVQISLISITKFKINDLDYYSAFHNITRSSHLNIKSKTIEMYKLFTQAVVFLMKRKIKQAVINLDNLLKNYLKITKKGKLKQQIEKYQEEQDYILKRFYVYRAYGYFFLGQHQLCIVDYEQSQKYTPIQRHGRYNLLLAQAIVKVKNIDFQQGYQLFDKAKAIYPNKIQPLIYKAVTLVQNACSRSISQINKIEVLLQGLRELDLAYEINSNHSNMLYIKTLFHYSLGKINEGLESISKAMAKSQQNNPKYFYCRGLGNGSIGNYKQCQNDFTIVINLDSKYSQAYLQRAKVLVVLNNIQKALEDIKQYSNLSPFVDKQYFQGNIFFSIHDFEAAILKYDLAEQNQQTIIMKTKSYIYLGQLKFALNIIQKLNNPSYYIGDETILKYLINCQFPNNNTLQQQLKILSESINVSHRMFNSVHIYHYIGSIYFQLGKFKEAEDEFKKSIKQRQFLNVQNTHCAQEYQNNEAAEEALLEINQINYNIFLCNLMAKNMKKAHEVFVLKILPIKDLIQQGDVLVQLSEMILDSLKGVEQIKQTIHELDITMFENSLSNATPSIIIPLKKGQLKTKLCHMLPSSVLRSMNSQINQKQIISLIKITQIENKPQPPWVRRNDQSTLIFTGQIQDTGIQFQTQQNHQTTQYQQQHKTSEQDVSSSHFKTKQMSKYQQRKTNLQKLKEVFRLNESVEKKLNIFIKKRNNNK